jgi:hypothetical protein
MLFERKRLGSLPMEEHAICRLQKAHVAVDPTSTSVGLYERREATAISSGALGSIDEHVEHRRGLRHAIHFNNGIEVGMNVGVRRTRQIRFREGRVCPTEQECHESKQHRR